jgi:hypothetical protein
MKKMSEHGRTRRDDAPLATPAIIVQIESQQPSQVLYRLAIL